MRVHVEAHRDKGDVEAREQKKEMKRGLRAGGTQIKSGIAPLQQEKKRCLLALRAHKELGD